MNERYDDPEFMMFDANLREFAERVNTICSLEAGGKLSPDDSYQRIRSLWKQLKRSHSNLGIAEKAED